MHLTVSGSNTRLDGTRECNLAAVLVLPQPKVPLSQTITRSCYECSHARAAQFAGPDEHAIQGVREPFREAGPIAPAGR